MKIVNRVCVALSKNKKFLLLRRSKHSTSAGIWEFPGGTVNKGESFSEAAKREVLEETGLKCHKLKFVTSIETFYDNKFVISHFFYCDKFKGKITLSEEHDRYKWVSKRLIMKMKPAKNIGTDVWLFFHKIENNKIFNRVLEKFVRNVKRELNRKVASLMLVGSHARNDSIPVWSDLDVVVFIRNKGKPINREILQKLRKIVKKSVAKTKVQLWLKIHTEDTFPHKLDESSIVNYYQDGKILFGEDIKKLLKLKLKEAQEKIKNKASTKILENRFYSRYYYTSLNEWNKELGTIHIDRDKDDAIKMVAGQIIDKVIDIAQYALYSKKIFKTAKREIALEFANQFKSDPYRFVPLQLVGIRSMWPIVTKNELDYVIKAGLDFIEHFASKFVKQSEGILNYENCSCIRRK